jgi:hypothetical protein
MQNHESTMASVSSLTVSRIVVCDDMCVCVCAEPLEVEIDIGYQLVV